MAKTADKLPGGRADKVPVSSFNEADVAEGAKHELEHTNDVKVAREIARDHLTEDKKYYKKLKQMEKALVIPANFAKSLNDYGANWFEFYRGTPFYAEALKLEREHMVHEVERKAARQQDEERTKTNQKVYDQMAANYKVVEKKNDALRSKLKQSSYAVEAKSDQQFYTSHDAKVADLRMRYLAHCESEEKAQAEENKMSKSNSVFEEIMARDISEDLIKSDAVTEPTQGAGTVAVSEPELSKSDGAVVREALGLQVANLDAQVQLQPVQVSELSKSEDFGAQYRAAMVSQLRGGGASAFVKYSTEADDKLSKSFDSEAFYHFAAPTIKRDAPLLRSNCCGLCKSMVPGFLTVCQNCNSSLR